MESVEEPSVQPNDQPEVSETAVVEKASVTPEKTKNSTVKVSKKLLWWSIAAIVIIVLGLSIWRFKWYAPIYAHFESGSISLKVKEGDKFPIEGAKIVLNGTTYTTDSNGKITVAAILKGSYKAHVTKDGYTPVDQAVTVRRGDNELVLIALTKIPEKLYSVGGIIQDEVSGKTVVDVQITLAGSSKQSNPNGEFSFTAIAPGDYKLILSKAGYLDKELPVTVKDSDVSNPTIPLVPSGQVIFVSNRDGKRALYTANYDGSDQKQFVTPQNGGEDYGPTLSPDKKWVVFSSSRDQVKTPYGDVLAKLYIASRDGKTVKKVSDDVGVSSLMWSPDGHYVYYTAYTTPAETTTVQRFYDVSKGSTFDLGDASVSQVIFNSTGSTVAYTTSVYGGGSDYTNTLKLLTLATGERTTLASKTGPAFSNISFIDSNRSVAYELVQATTRHRYEVEISTLHEVEAALLTTNDQHVYVLSPNGKQKAFLENRDGKEDLFLVDLDGKNEKRLTSLGVANVHIPVVWDESGKYLTFAVKREGENALYVVSTDGGDPKKVVDFYDDQTYPAYY